VYFSVFQIGGGEIVIVKVYFARWSLLSKQDFKCLELSELMFVCNCYICNLTKEDICAG